jgi:hypothetical protein
MNNELENYIHNNRDELDRAAPDAAILARILEEMKSKRQRGPHRRVVPLRLLKWAAACLLAVACCIAGRYFNRQQRTREVVKSTVPQKQPQPASGDKARSAIDTVNKSIAVQKKAFMGKVNAKQTGFGSGLYNMQSAAGRIQAIAEISRRKNNTQAVIDVLIHTLNNDPNTTVRLAALDRLTIFYKKVYVRKALITSLKKQQDPVVQINLIDLLTQMRERNVLSGLEQLVNDKNTHKTVRDMAYSGILQLRPEMIN